MIACQSTITSDAEAHQSFHMWFLTENLPSLLDDLILLALSLNHGAILSQNGYGIYLGGGPENGSPDAGAANFRTQHHRAIPLLFP